MKANRSVVPIFGFVIIGLIFVLGGILFTQSLYAADYSIDNGTATESTNTTAMISGAESMWFYGLAILASILGIGLVLWKFFIK